MPCESCQTQFTVFKRKKSCNECHRYFCVNCIAKTRFCQNCSILVARPLIKDDLLKLRTSTLITYLQSKKIPTTGCVEKSELVNLIINHVNTSTYYESSTPNFTNTSTNNNNNNDFDFDQIKNTCQNFLSSISEKISSDLQKTTCFTNSNQPNQKKTNITTQPRPRSQQESTPTSPQTPLNVNATSSSSSSSNHTAAGTSNNGASYFRNSNTPVVSLNQNQNSNTNRPTRTKIGNTSGNTSPLQPSQNASTASSPRNSIPSARTEHHHEDCDCSDDELDEKEISEKRQNIFDNNNAGPSGWNINLFPVTVKKSSSSESSSFEELEPTPNGDHWQFIERTSSNEVKIVADGMSLGDGSNSNTAPSPNQNSSSNSNDMTRSLIPEPSSSTSEHRRITRRRSDSSILSSMKKSSSLIIDASAMDPLMGPGEVKKVKVSCNKCGKEKRIIKLEIIKLSEQLRSSNRSDAEVNAKVKEFIDYLDSKSQPSEVTDTENSQNGQRTVGSGVASGNIPTSNSNDDIEEDIFDDINDGIHVYGTNLTEQQQSETNLRRFVQLDDIHTTDDLDVLTVKQLKEILMLNRVDFKGCCEKNELKERVTRLWEHHLSALPSDKLTSDDLCKICMDAPIECVFLECGHMATCTNCGKVLNECPICRQYIIRCVRFFKS
ncbi:unnamed protein product [Diamesa hyperborea]